MQQTCPHCQGEGEMHDPSVKNVVGLGISNEIKLYP